MATQSGAGVPTVDLHIDCHRVASSGALRAEGEVIARGSTLATADARIYAADGTLFASSRGGNFVGARGDVAARNG